MKIEKTAKGFRFAALSLAAIMTVSLVACTQTNGGEPTAAGTDNSGETAGTEKITLTAMGNIFGDSSTSDDAVGRMIEEKLGIHLDITMATPDKLKVLAAGGDLPDIVELWESGSIAKELVSSGSIIALDDLLDSHGAVLKEKMPFALKWSKEVFGGGQTYIIPSAIQTLDKGNPNLNGFVGFFTRWDLYKDLDYPEMNNEDDYIAVLAQMMEKNPTTADGRKVYGLSAWSDWGLWPYMIAYPFSHGYNNMENNQLLNQATGELEDMFLLEDGVFWRGLNFFNKAYRAGVMDPEAFTMKNGQYADKIKNGEVLVSFAEWNKPDVNVLGEDAGMHILPDPFPYAASVFPIRDNLGYLATNSLCISKNCKNPEKAMELINFVTSDDGARLIYSGIQGEDWDVVDGVPQLIGKRLDNFLSNNTVEKDYQDPKSPQGISKYDWLGRLWYSNMAADGQPVDLTKSMQYKSQSARAADIDFTAYYGGEDASYPGQAYVALIEQGKLKSVEENLMVGKLMVVASDETVRTTSKAMEYFQANIAQIIMCESDEAFAAQKAKMIEDIKAMDYETALAEIQANFEQAKIVEQSFTN